MDQLLYAHKHASHHRQQLQNDSKCGCFHCGQIFVPPSITEWIDGENTATCPHCGIDSVIGESSGYPITAEFLKEM